MRMAVRGRPLPDIIANPPKLAPYLALAWKAFWDLRTGIDDINAIKWVDVQYWCDTFDLDQDDSAVIHESITVLDVVFIKSAVDRRKLANAKAELEAKNGAKNSDQRSGLSNKNPSTRGKA